MKIVYGSDLHNEFEEQKTVPEFPEADLIILAGDIHKGLIGPAWAGLMTADSKTPVIYCVGNHEYYGYDKAALDEIYNNWSHENVMILNPGVVEVGDFVIIGATLHSALELPNYKRYAPVAYERAVGDFIVTKGWTANAHVARHQVELQFIVDNLIKYKDKRCIVVTHFVPTMQCIAPFFEGSDLNPYFVNNLDWLIDHYKPEAWIFGHTHTTYNKVHTNGKTKLLCKPRGYPGEKKPKYKWGEVDL